MILCLQSPGSFALGLGDYTLKTWLGEPLDAEIELIGGETLEGQSIRVRQIRGEEAERLGFDLAAEAPPVRVRVIERQQRFFLSVNSRTPINEPFVNILLQLSVPTGTLLREYTFFIDLNPGVNSRPPVAAATPRVEPAEEQIAPPPAISNQARTVEDRSIEEARLSWRVQPGDTLGQIAQRLRPYEGIQLKSIVEALFRMNAHAFENGDINRLKGGSLLIAPSMEEYMSMPLRKGYARITPGQAPLPAPAAEEAAPTQTPSPRPKPQTSQAPPPPITEKVASYRVKPGDTLSSIAKRVRGSTGGPLGPIVQQLFDDNPQAFANGNMDRLMAGSTLRIRRASAIVSALKRDREQPATIRSGDQATPTQTEPGSTASPGRPPADAATVSGQVELTQPELDSDAVLAGYAAGQPPQVKSTGEALAHLDIITAKVETLNRENNALQEKLDNLQNNDRVSMLEELLQLQQQQIDALNQKQEATPAPEPSVSVETAAPEPAADVETNLPVQVRTDIGESNGNTAIILALSIVATILLISNVLMLLQWRRPVSAGAGNEASGVHPDELIKAPELNEDINIPVLTSEHDLEEELDFGAIDAITHNEHHEREATDSNESDGEDETFSELSDLQAIDEDSDPETQAAAEESGSAEDDSPDDDPNEAPEIDESFFDHIDSLEDELEFPDLGANINALYGDGKMVTSSDLAKEQLDGQVKSERGHSAESEHAGDDFLAVMELDDIDLLIEEVEAHIQQGNLEHAKSLLMEQLRITPLQVNVLDLLDEVNEKLGAE